MSIDAYTIIFTLLNLLILYLFLRKKLFNTVTNFMQKRTESIANQIQEAEMKLNDAQAAKLEYEERLKEANQEGQKIVEECRSDAVKRSDDIVEEAKKEAELIRQRANTDAEREYERVKDEIKKQIVSLSLLAASKSISGQLDENKHHALIEEFINKVGV